MTDERIIKSIVEKCDFLYDDAVLTKETVIEKYLTFFARQFDPSERSVSFAFHTGSLCFDVVSVAALMIGCLAYEFSSNDEILAELDTDDMVLYKGERYRWKGIKEDYSFDGKTKINYAILQQDGKGKNGATILHVPYDKNKHLIKPYFGTSLITDGRGIRKDSTNRNDFISYILDIPLAEVPSSLDISVVVVADKNEFLEICKHLKIRYKEDKTVALTDVVPVSYYTGTGEQFQIGRNASKAEAVIKVTGKLSPARDLVLDRSGNPVIGLLVTNVESLDTNASELNDILRRKSLKFAYVTAPFSSASCELAMEQYESAKMFACTKELLSSSNHEIGEPNKLTAELNRQINNILAKETETVCLDGCWSWEEYKQIKQKLYAVKQSNWSGEDRDNFILSAMALLNLFGTAFFGMKRMEEAIVKGKINAAVVSPKVRLSEIEDIALKTMSMHDQCVEIVASLQKTYLSIYNESPKEAALARLLTDHSDKRIAVVVPKAYYAELFGDIFGERFPNAICITANRFDRHAEYDVIITPGDIIGKRFDAIQCFTAPKVLLLLYEFETKTFSYRKRKSVKSERKLNARIKGMKEPEKDIPSAEETEDDETVEESIREFSDLDEYVESMGMFDIRKLASGSGGGNGESYTAEVKFVGTFTTGEQILFSKYYNAVVFNPDDSTVTETSPDKLVPGDILVFTKRNDYTSNIVDHIFDQLIHMRKLSEDVLDAAEKAFYWKECLREYKAANNLTYRAVAKQMKKYGSSLQEVTIRQWLMDESRIVGPRDVKTMNMIAQVTQDRYILSDPQAYFEACSLVRSYRRKILNLIADAINDKLSNKQPKPGSAFEVVYENVEKLSETMELEKVFELDDTAIINNGMVNRPISEAEVSM